MFWLLKPETGLLLAEIIETKKIIDDFTLADIDNMENRIIINYSNKAYPLLTDNEILLVNKLTTENKLDLIKNSVVSNLINNYWQPKEKRMK